MRSHDGQLLVLGLTLAGVVACAGGATEEAAPAPAPRPAAAQPATSALPNAESLYDAMVDATGGRAALEAYRSSHATGRFSMPAMGIEGSLDVYAAQPNRLFIRVDIPGIGTVTQGFDGEVAWSNNPMTGPMVLDGLMRDQMRQQADFYGPLNRAEYVRSAETVEIADFEGRPCYKVRVRTHWDEEYFDYIDTETGLAAGSVRNQDSPMGPVETTVVLSDYREFGRILTPTSMIQRSMGQEQVISVTAVDYDTVDESIFDLPDAIRTLVGR